MSTLFVWTGKGGPDWDSTSGTITNWVITPGGTNTIVPSSGTTLEAVADFNDGGIHSVGGGGDADQISIIDNTTVTLQSGHFRAGDLDAANNADFPDDLVVDNGSKLIIASDGAMANSGSVSVIGLGNDLFGGSGGGTLEVDSGGGFSAEALIIGDGTAGVGVVTANGAAGFFVVAAPGDSGNGELTIGYAGTGSLEITNTAAVFTEGAVLGLNQGAVGSLSLDSSTWGGGGVTLGAAGTGHMTIGAGASVALLDMVVGSAQTGSGDLLVNGASFGVDFLSIGMDGTGTATFGTDSIGQFTTVTVGESADAIANLALNGSTWNTGSLTIGLTGTGHATAGAGEVITVNNAVLGSGADASGDLTVDGAVLNGGTVAIGQDGTGDLEIGSGSSGSVAAVIVGEDAASSGTLTIEGADWSVGSLTVGLSGSGQATIGTGATATLDNILIGPDGDLAVTEAAGSVGTVIAQQVTIDFGTLDVSQGGQVLIGAATGTDGAVAIGNKSSLTGLGSLNGDVVLSNGGLVQATAAVPGALKIDGNITGAGTIEPLMTLEVNGAIDSSVDITFSPSAGAQVGDLVLDVPAGEQGTINGFSIGNTIDVQGSLYSTAIFTQGTTGSPGTLTLSGSSAPLSLMVSGDYAPNSFVATSGSTDTVVTLVPCFAAGTRIATEAGDVPVEALTIGTRMRCVQRGIAPAVWIGRRHIDVRRHADPPSVWPILIEHGAFADDMPYRDLLLSPDHAVFINGMLIPVRYLANGRSIRQVPVDEVTYFHVELARHDVLLAEGLPVESYLDSGDRWNFSNGDEAVVLHPDFATRISEALGCAPLVLTGSAFTDVRRRLAARSASLVNAA